MYIINYVPFSSISSNITGGKYRTRGILTMMETIVSTQLYVSSIGNHSMLRLSAKVIRTVLCARSLEMAIHSVK